jgi:hypothetical protein
LHGMNAWPASGRDLATYQEGLTNEQESAAKRDDGGDD